MTELEKYFKEVFGTIRPEKEKIEKALNRAHEVRQFEIRLYWQRSLFFWGFILTFFTAFAALFDMEKREFTEAGILVGLSVLGFFTTFAWYHIETGSKTWQKNWEYHIDFLESHVTGNLHKTIIGKPCDFWSLANIHKSFIFVVGLGWLGLVLISGTDFWDISKNNSNGYELKDILVIMALMIAVFLSPLPLRGNQLLNRKGYWQTSDETLPKGEHDKKET